MLKGISFFFQAHYINHLLIFERGRIEGDRKILSDALMFVSISSGRDIMLP